MLKKRSRMSQVRCTGKHLLMEVEFNGVTYECLTSFDCKDLLGCEPEPENWLHIEDLIRDAAWRGEIENLDLLG